MILEMGGRRIEKILKGVRGTRNFESYRVNGRVVIVLGVKIREETVGPKDEACV
jgi:hypothetical protein